jgi:WD40 repeat protein
MSAALWRWRPVTEVDSSAFIWLASLRGPSLQEWRGLSNVAWHTDSTSLVLIDTDGRTRAAFTDGRDLGRSRERTAPTAPTGGGPEGTQSGRRSFIPLVAEWMRTGVLHPGFGPRLGSRDGLTQLTSDSAMMLTAAAERVRLWRTDDGREIRRIGTPAPVTRFTMSSADQYLATWDSAGAVTVWDLGHPSEVLRVPGGRIASASADGRRIAVGTSLGVSIATQDSVTPLVSIPLLGGAGKVVVSRDGRYVVAVGGDPSGINLLGDRLRTVVLDLDRGVDTVLTTVLASVAEFTPDSRSLVLGTKDSLVRLIRLDDRATRWEKRFDGGRATRVAFSADGRVATLAIEPPFRSTAVAVVVSTETGDVLRRIDRRSSNALALSADGSELASASDTVLTIVRVRDGAVTAQLRHPPPLGTIRHVAFLDSGRVVSIAGKLESNFMAYYFTDEGAFLWNARTGTIESRLPGDISRGNTAGARPHLSSMTWTAHGREVAALVFEDREEYWGTPSALARGEVRVWRLGGTTPEEVFRASPDSWSRLVGLSDEAGLVFTTGHGGLRALSYHQRALVAEACRRLTRSLTAAEWHTLIGVGEPRPTCAAPNQR